MRPTVRYDRLRCLLVVVAGGLAVLPRGLFAQLPSTEAPEEGATSHVRVVRLSYVSGSVSVNRPGSSEAEKALMNTPLQEGFGLATSGNSYAEAEFENGSTARLGELSSLIFNQLALDAQGDKLNRLTLEGGYATFHFLPEHLDVFSVNIADATLTPEGKCEFRTDFIQGRLRLEIFHGSIQVATPSKSAQVGENKTLEYTPGAPEEAFQIRNGIVIDDWDKWTEARETQVQMAMRDESVKTQQGLYGWSDLDAYGEWADIPGSGYGWAPYAQAGWSPFSSGMWNWYSALGWTWVSNEPGAGFLIIVDYGIMTSRLAGFGCPQAGAGTGTRPWSHGSVGQDGWAGVHGAGVVIRVRAGRVPFALGLVRALTPGSSNCGRITLRQSPRACFKTGK